VFVVRLVLESGVEGEKREEKSRVMRRGHVPGIYRPPAGAIATSRYGCKSEQISARRRISVFFFHDYESSGLTEPRGVQSLAEKPVGYTHARLTQAAASLTRREN
jgi:hypothetical protein